MRHRRASAWVVAAGLAVAVLVLRAAPASSAGGTIDTTYGASGLVAIDTGSGSYDAVADLALQADGRAVLLGTTSSGFALSRIGTTGTPDTTFGTGGTLTGTFITDARGLALQSDGKPVITGRASDGSLVLARYLATGAATPDASFGTSGRVTVPMTGTGSGGLDVALQADGKPVVLGLSAGVLSIFRYSTTGSPDATFGTGGRFTSTLAASDGTGRIAIQSDGKIVVTTAGGVARLTSVGALDPAFGSSGVAVTANHVTRAVAMAGDGKVVAGGDLGAFGTNAIVVRRTTNGGLDVGFGSGGVASFAVPGLARASVRAVAVQADGKVVAVGRLGDTSRPSALFVARLTASGVLDATFATNGIATFSSVGGQSTSSVDGVALIGTTGYLLGGSVINTSRNLPNDNDLMAARVTASSAPVGGGSTTTTVPGAVGAGGTVSSDPEGTSPDSENKVVASVTTPLAGTVGFTKGNGTAAAGFRLLGGIAITAPAASASSPLRISLTVDSSTVPDELPLGSVSVLLSSTPVTDCSGSTTASPDPCIASRSRGGGIHTLTVLSSKGGTFTLARPLVQRIFGDDRIASAIAVSRSSYANAEASAVVLARGDSFADALAATPLAVGKKAPLLLVGSGTLDDRVLAEIIRVLPEGKPVYVLGGERAVPAAVSTRIERWGYEIIRFAGADRYETAVLVATEGLNSPGSVILTTGLNFADALAAGTAAAASNAAVLLTQGSLMPDATKGYLEGRSPSVLAMGGPAARAMPDAGSVVGDDRYETAVLAAKLLFSEPTVIGVASGTSFADALAGGVHTAAAGGPLLLTPPTGTLPAAVSIYLRGFKTVPVGAFLYGGVNAVGADAGTGLLSALGG